MLLGHVSQRPAELICASAAWDDAAGCVSVCAGARLCCYVVVFVFGYLGRLCKLDGFGDSTEKGGTVYRLVIKDGYGL